MNTPTEPLSMTPEICQREVPLALIELLKERFSDQFSIALAVREHHGRDESSFAAPPPAGVLFAQSTQDVVDVLKDHPQLKRSNASMDILEIVPMPGT